MTPEEKLEILAARVNGVSYTEIERVYGVKRNEVIAMLNCDSVGATRGPAITIPVIFPNIQTWIIENKESITSMAKKLGITRQALGNYLHGERDMPKRICDGIIKLTGMTYEEAFCSNVNE